MNERPDPSEPIQLPEESAGEVPRIEAEDSSLSQTELSDAVEAKEAEINEVRRRPDKTEENWQEVHRLIDEVRQIQDRLQEVRTRGRDDELTLAASVVTLGLSERTLEVLKKAQIETIGEVAQKSSEDLLAITNMGIYSTREIERALDAAGIKHSIEANPH